MLHSFKDTAEHTLRIVESIKALLAKYTDKDYLLTLKGQYEPLYNTVNLIFKKVYVRISDVVDLGIHRQTAAAYLEQLVDEGLLSKERVGRENIYKKTKIVPVIIHSKTSPYISSSKRYKISFVPTKDANPLLLRVEVSGDDASLFGSVVTEAWSGENKLLVQDGFIIIPDVKRNKKVSCEVLLTEKEHCALEVTAYVKK